MNVNLQSFYDISHNRAHNLGSVYVHRDLGGGTSLYRANHHRILPNMTTLTPAQNREVRQAFADALKNEKRLAPHLLAEIRTRLGLVGAHDAHIAARPLERREIKAIFDMIEARKTLQANFLSRQGAPSKVSRMLDLAIAHLTHHADDFAGHGVSAFDHAMRNMAISRAYYGLLNELSQHLEPEITESDIRQRVAAEYEHVRQDFHAALSKCEQKGVYRHLAILDLKASPADGPDELWRALSVLDELGGKIQGLADMDDAAATKAIYEQLCSDHGEQPNQRLNTLTQTREIRRLLAADERGIRQGNLHWVESNWDNGANLKGQVEDKFGQLGLSGDIRDFFMAKVKSRLGECRCRLEGLDAEKFGEILDAAVKASERETRTRLAQLALDRLVDGLADRMFDILQNGDRPDHPESKDAVRSELGQTREEIRNTISGLFRNSPKAVQLVKLFAAGEIDPAQLERFKETLAHSLQENYAQKQKRNDKVYMFREVIRVRAQDSRLIDAVTINGKSVPERPAHPELIPEDLRLEINNWCGQNEAKRNRTLAFVEALFNLMPNKDEEMLFAVSSLLGLNGVQMSFNDAIYQMKLLKDDLFMDPEYMSGKLYIDPSGGPTRCDNPADIRLDPKTGHITVSTVVTRGFKVLTLKGCGVDKDKGAGLGATAYYRVGVEIAPAAQQGGTPTTTVTSIEKTAAL